MNKKNRSDKKIIPNIKNLPLAEYFASLPKAERIPIIISAPKKEIVHKIAEVTKRDPHTVKRWMLGYMRPNSAIERQIIADMLESTVDILFPEVKPAIS